MASSHTRCADVDADTDQVEAYLLEWNSFIDSFILRFTRFIATEQDTGPRFEDEYLVE